MSEHSPSVDIIVDILQRRWAPTPEMFLPPALAKASRQSLAQRRASTFGAVDPLQTPYHVFSFHSLFKRPAGISPLVNTTNILSPATTSRKSVVTWEEYGCVYHCTRPAQIPLQDYVQRIIKYFRCAEECYPIALALLDRFVEATEVAIDDRNVFRLFLTAVLVATKSREDFWHTMSYYAHVGGISPQELKALEVHFLFSVGWDVIIPEHVYNQIAKGVGMCAVVARPPISWRALVSPPVAQFQRRAPPTTTSTATGASPPLVHIVGGSSSPLKVFPKVGSHREFIPSSATSPFTASLAPESDVEDLSEYHVTQHHRRRPSNSLLTQPSSTEELDVRRYDDL